jgi:uncharacterized repeat protein (TIGR03803 family)
MRSKRLLVGGMSIVAVLVVTLFVTGSASAQEPVLHSFNYNDGDEPIAGVILDASGNLYGTTFYGGAFGNGTVFRLTPDAGGWRDTVLYSFNGDGGGGFWANTRLIFDGAGNLYGTTFFGGAFGTGTVFELSPAEDGTWSERTLHSFASHGGDGAYPHAGLTLDSSGNLYGTTSSGGAGYGTVFELTPASGGTWTETVLLSFSAGGGANPYSSLVLDASGNLYGTTASGGKSSACRDGCGTVFELSAHEHWAEKVIHTFDNTDGANPYGGLIFDGSGNLYGTTSQGAEGNFGTVFELSPAPGGWRLKTLHNFNSNGTDGYNSSATLIFDTAGNLYGTTLSGGAHGQGTVFELSPPAGGNWTEKILSSFGSAGRNGYDPTPGLVLDSDGNLYGTTVSGGGGTNPNCINGCGTVYQITP